jgi:hypothetical protein
MSTQQFVHEDVLRLDVIGDLLLPDLHITLERVLASMPEECRVIRLDLRQACVDADQTETEKFVDHLAESWVPRLQGLRGRLIVCSHESAFENGAASLCRTLSVLSRRFIGLTVVTSFNEPHSDQAATSDSEPSIPKTGATLFDRINLLVDSDEASPNIRDLPIVSEETAVA